MLKRFIAATVAVFTTTSALAMPIKTDFVFMIDATSSMGGEIAGVRAGFSSFVGGLNAASVDARFAIIVFGGPSELVFDFSSDQTATQTALNSITIGPNPGFQNNHNLNPEAGLEAIRMALNSATNNALQTNNSLGTVPLTYRNDARKNLILVTDEDSDCPFYNENDVGGACGGISPQAEIDATAMAVINANAYLNMLISTQGGSRGQYGDYQYDVSDADFLNFDEEGTLANLLGDATTANSLQAQILGADLIGRSFNVAGANNADFVDNFFAAKLQEVTQDDPCDINPSLPQCNTVPAPGTLALIGLGLFGFRLTRRKRSDSC